MAVTKNKELAQMDIPQLKVKYAELKKELIKLNMQRASGTPPENPGMVKATRKAITRINTYISQKENTKTITKSKEEKLNSKSKTKKEDLKKTK